MVDSGRTVVSLEDFPLHGEGAAGRRPPLLAPEREPVADSACARVASLAGRFSAAAADAAAILLLSALAILAARFATGTSPRASGIPWVVAFLVYLSFFATVPPLVLFGRTVGMALADLSARSGAAEAGLSGPAAFRRWVGTLATVATAGLALLWTARSPEAPTPADRLSGHPLTLD